MDKLINNITNNVPKTDLKSSHKTINDVVEINSPKGQKFYTIKSIKYV